MKADPKDKGVGLLIGLEDDEGPKSKPMGKKAEGEGDEAEMKAARVDALKALKSALDEGDLEAADSAMQDYMACCEGSY